MTSKKKHTEAKIEIPSAERVEAELAKATNNDDFFGKEGVFARLFAQTLEQMREAEMSAELG